MKNFICNSFDSLKKDLMKFYNVEFGNQNSVVLTEYPLPQIDKAQKTSRKYLCSLCLLRALCVLPARPAAYRS